MALEAEQVQRMNQHTQPELGHGAAVRSRQPYPRFGKRKEDPPGHSPGGIENLEMQLQKEKDNSQHLETIHKVQYQALMDEHSPYKTLLRRSLEMESKAFRRRERDQLQHEAALRELRKELRELNPEREALKQAQEANALAAQEGEAATGGSQSQLLESADEGAAKGAIHPEQRDANLPGAPAAGSEALQAQYEGAKEEPQSMEISLKKLSSQCEVLSREKENFEEENHNLRRQSQTLAKEEQAASKRECRKVNFSWIIKEEEEGNSHGFLRVPGSCS
ncbi:hypothetical protein QTO34_005121 [Cnephaeus nilssonii]|uniref:Uncharacterized protein n=1 Tax=Cnephaeus nilssonii TaxID=3371016 RepID=A0AA40HMR7_CNENI|nr:hypothetical protein QTO34_005121 [Eptesicus nilssonii]